MGVLHIKTQQSTSVFWGCLAGASDVCHAGFDSRTPTRLGTKNDEERWLLPSGRWEQKSGKCRKNHLRTAQAVIWRREDADPQSDDPPLGWRFWDGYWRWEDDSWGIVGRGIGDGFKEVCVFFFVFGFRLGGIFLKWDKKVFFRLFCACFFVCKKVATDLIFCLLRRMKVFCWMLLLFFIFLVFSKTQPRFFGLCLKSNAGLLARSQSLVMGLESPQILPEEEWNGSWKKFGEEIIRRRAVAFSAAVHERLPKSENKNGRIMGSHRSGGCRKDNQRCLKSACGRRTLSHAKKSLKWRSDGQSPFGGPAVA